MRTESVVVEQLYINTLNDYCVVCCFELAILHSEILRTSPSAHCSLLTEKLFPDYCFFSYIDRDKK